MVVTTSIGLALWDEMREYSYKDLRRRSFQRASYKPDLTAGPHDDDPEFVAKTETILEAIRKDEERAQKSKEFWDFLGARR